jgi:hypothetical protein
MSEVERGDMEREEVIAQVEELSASGFKQETSIQKKEGRKKEK